MCLSNNTSSPVRFSGTILGGFEVKAPDGTIEHVCAYYNEVATPGANPGISGPALRRSAETFGYSSRGTRAEAFGYDVPPTKGNAMLLAVPAKKGTIQLVEVGKMPNLMRDYQRAVTPPRPVTRSASFGAKGLSDSMPVVVKAFDGGVYDVIIAPTASSIASVLDQVDEEKRPAINASLYAELDKLYGEEFQFLLYCFSETPDQRGGCAVAAYQPHDKWSHLMFLPGLDGHNGKVETGDVEVDHTIVLGSFRMGAETGRPVEFTDKVERPYRFPSRVIGTTITREMPQGDFLFPLKKVRVGEFIGKRAMPPKSTNPGEELYFGIAGAQV